MLQFNKALTFFVCLPAAGNNGGNNAGSNGYYWSSTQNNSTNGYNLNFNSDNSNPSNNNNKANGFSLKEKLLVTPFAQNLPVYKALYDLLFALYNQVRHFPKEFQYTLGERIKSQVTELVELVYQANKLIDLSLKMEEISRQVNGWQLKGSKI